MSAATAMATELGDRIRTEGDKQLRKLEVLSHAVPKKHKKAKAKKHSKLGMLTFVAMCGGIAYAFYRMLRTAPYEAETYTSRDMPESDTGLATPKPTVRSA